MKELTIIIPSYNESANLKRGVLEGVSSYLEKLKINYEVLIVDDGSSDNSVELVKKYISKMGTSSRGENLKLIQNKHGGKAKAVLTGMEKASGETVLFTDMDQATPINQLEKFIPKFKEGYDIVIGSRKGRKGAPMIRKIAAWIFSILRGLILGLPFKDTQCGFKAFSKNSVNKILPKIRSEWGELHFRGGAVNAGFDVELLYLSKKYGLKIAEVGVEWNYVDTERVQVVKDALAAIYDMLRIRMNDFRGKY
ncbi:glycosyltransferase [Candidatus Daviesbacteria bacterium]|nr:glycosyltransferase [Candidatus Daviesbacteria bacterium]